MHRQHLQDSNSFAFKEWSVVCEALNSGQQSLILRKGGIHEGSDGFRVDHREFWLFPTGFHQNPDDLAPEATSLLGQFTQQQPSGDEIIIRNYVSVQDVIEIRDQALLERLKGLHIWSEKTVLNRFHYRSPGLFALLVRCFQRADSIRIPNNPRFAGCRSWVEFDSPLPTVSAVPVLIDREHDARMALIREKLGIS